MRCVLGNSDGPLVDHEPARRCGGGRISTITGRDWRDQPEPPPSGRAIPPEALPMTLRVALARIGRAENLRFP